MYSIIIPVAILTIQPYQALGQHNPHFKSGRSVIVHLFEWKFNDVANECESFLGPKGFAGVQLSPVNENLVIKLEDGGRPWWERYQPISYKILTRSGNEEEFLNMTKRCNAAGVRIYADVVLNHMAAANENMTGTAGSTANGYDYDFHAVPYTKEDFHNMCTIDDYQDAHVIRNCQLLTLPDLDQSLPNVRGKIVEYLDHLVDLGVAGFRIDAAKHMWPGDLQVIYSNIKNLSTDFDFPENARPFIYQEVIDMGGEATTKTEYTNLGVVTEFLYSAEIGTIFNGIAPLNSLVNWGPVTGFLPHQDALVFVDNHDNQRGHGSGGELILSHKKPKRYQMAVAFMLAHPYGMPRVMSSYEFNNTDQGPPADVDDNIETPTFDEDDDDTGLCNNGWICEHRWNSIQNMVKFRNVVEDETIINWQDNGPNQVAFCRGNKGFIAFNNDPEHNFEAEMFACMAPGEYCDVISGQVSIDGGCTGTKILVSNESTVNISIPFDGNEGVIAIHSFSKVE